MTGRKTGIYTRTRLHESIYSAKIYIIHRSQSYICLVHTYYTRIYIRDASATFGIEPKNDGGVPRTRGRPRRHSEAVVLLTGRGWRRVLWCDVGRSAVAAVGFGGTMRGCPSLPPTAGGGAFGSILRLTFSYFFFRLFLFLFFLDLNTFCSRRATFKSLNKFSCCCS